VFERPGYTDDDPKVAADIVALMSEVYFSVTLIAIQSADSLAHLLDAGIRNTAS
jgi:hypothetical protein